MSDTRHNGPFTVYYDGACPICVREMQQYQRWARPGAVHWFDITGREEQLRARGIDPDEALMELHLEDRQGQLFRGVDAFILLWAQIPLARPLARVAAFAPLKWLIRRSYGWFTRRRLRRDGRLPGRYCKKRS